MAFEIVSVPSPMSTYETAVEYGPRLGKLDFDEMRIRQEVLRHYSSTNLNSNYILNSLSDTQVRYTTMIHQLNPAKPHKRVVKKN